MDLSRAEGNANILNFESETLTSRPSWKDGKVFCWCLSRDLNRKQVWTIIFYKKLFVPKIMHVDSNYIGTYLPATHLPATHLPATYLPATYLLPTYLLPPIYELKSIFWYRKVEDIDHINLGLSSQNDLLSCEGSHSLTSWPEFSKVCQGYNYWSIIENTTIMLRHFRSLFHSFLSFIQKMVGTAFVVMRKCLTKIDLNLAEANHV